MLAEMLSLSVGLWENILMGKGEIKFPTDKNLKNEHPLRTDVDASLVVN